MNGINRFENAGEPASHPEANRRNRLAATHAGGLSLIELLVVIVLLAVLATIGGNRLAARQSGALSAACANNLMKTGKTLAQYQSASMFNSMPLAGAHREYDSDAATLDPFLCFWKSGLLQDSMQITCPVGGGPILFGDRNPESVASLGNPAQAGTQAATQIQSGTQAASNYLFTWYYRKQNARNRVIAGDAAGSPGTNSGYSPNHGDTAEIQEQGANALFADGQVKNCGAKYLLPGAEARSGEKEAGNFWDRAFSLSQRTHPARDGIGSALGGY